jgi:hypothetical protein
MRRSRRDLNWCGAALLTVFAWRSVAMGAPRDPGEGALSREVVLTKSAPRADFPLDEEQVSKGRTTVVIRVVGQENPDHADFSVAVLLVGGHGGNETQTAPVGSLGIYPTGENEGSYAFDIGPALKQMRSASPRQVCIRMELKPMRAAADWKRLRVTVSRPEWEKPPEK